MEQPGVHLEVLLAVETKATFVARDELGSD